MLFYFGLLRQGLMLIGTEKEDVKWSMDWGGLNRMLGTLARVEIRYM